MNLIITMEESIKKDHQKNWYTFLLVEKTITESNFEWIRLKIDERKKSLVGTGSLALGNNIYKVSLSYSPFYRYRYDRIYVNDKSIKFNHNIHLYSDLSLCLYHPILDKPFLKTITLYRMIPWISEWIIFYQQWKKYGIWLGKEIKHL